MKKKTTILLAFILALVSQVAFAYQQNTITGTVTDSDGLPLPGVNVVIKGTSTGVQTDFDGNYSIEAEKGAALVYSFVGLKTVAREADVVMLDTEFVRIRTFYPQLGLIQLFDVASR